MLKWKLLQVSNLARKYAYLTNRLMCRKCNKETMHEIRKPCIENASCNQSKRKAIEKEKGKFNKNIEYWNWIVWQGSDFFFFETEIWQLWKLYSNIWLVYINQHTSTFFYLSTRLHIHTTNPLLLPSSEIATHNHHHWWYLRFAV